MLAIKDCTNIKARLSIKPNKVRPSIKQNKVGASPGHPVATLPRTPSTCPGVDTYTDSRDSARAYSTVDARTYTRIDIWVYRRVDVCVCRRDDVHAYTGVSLD